LATKSPSKGGGKGLSAPVQPSAELAPIVGDKPIPRSEVTKKVWDYIKANGLQDQQNKRMINADDKLRVIFGGKSQVSMFEMTALVNKHLKA
jgi:chromatin remodeling complex protein RSC6